MLQTPYLCQCPLCAGTLVLRVPYCAQTTDVFSPALSLPQTAGSALAKIAHQISLAQGYTADCPSACCAVGPCQLFLIAGNRTAIRLIGLTVSIEAGKSRVFFKRRRYLREIYVIWSKELLRRKPIGSTNRGGCNITWNVSLFISIVLTIVPRWKVLWMSFAYFWVECA